MSHSTSVTRPQTGARHLPSRSTQKYGSQRYGSPFNPLPASSLPPPWVVMPKEKDPVVAAKIRVLLDFSTLSHSHIPLIYLEQSRKGEHIYVPILRDWVRLVIENNNHIATCADIYSGNLLFKSHFERHINKSLSTPEHVAEAKQPSNLRRLGFYFQEMTRALVDEVNPDHCRHLANAYDVPIQSLLEELSDLRSENYIDASRYTGGAVHMDWGLLFSGDLSESGQCAAAPMKLGAFNYTPVRCTNKGTVRGSGIGREGRWYCREEEHDRVPEEGGF
ncbi:hypothetical protein EJ08DRAFT_663738 [Tothia fuscella]|uniref:Uncharacterized protein n=1 Tax=Tothia fuscella TaxID=1048955 RepID=A0A9P4TUI8_9PEZI|nr:hypothetical protein EJ08DRAFT_663738 [Tothia fuscella]